MAFKLAIGPEVEVPVRLNVRNGGTSTDFKFHVTGKRLSAEEARDKLSGEGDNADLTIADFLKQNLIGWRDQRLVLDEDSGAPAPFGPEALAAMLGVAGAAGVIYTAYLHGLAASDGAEGRRKN